MMGNFPKDPTEKQLRTLIGFRVTGLVAFSGLATWQALDGNMFGAALIAALVVFFAAVSVIPRIVQLRKKAAARSQGND